MSTAPALEGSLWLFKDESDSAWKAVRGIFRPNSDIALTASAAWKQLKPEYINVKNSVPNIDVPSNSKGEAIDELKHLEVKAMLDALLQGPGQIILAGPPGTGKSHAARLLAAELVGSTGNVDDPNISFVQFHPTYEYEDFIEGFKPVLNSSGHFQLQQSPGLLMSLVNEMAEEPETARVLIVDEMNRANLSKVLGETLFLLEYRNTEITLKSGSSFSLPPNLLVISTMNTADRNIRSIDIALRRRFRYFELQPSEQALRAFFDAGHGVNLLGPLLFKGFTDLNQALTESLDRHHTIGHTFFMQPLLSPDTLSAAWQLQIGPLIEEYFFDQPDLANEFSFERFFGE
jgi:5-methylcytosine-specific restriction endonuclease McrBC GTP-binding regulatory subunit McrB